MPQCGAPRGSNARKFYQGIARELLHVVCLVASVFNVLSCIVIQNIDIEKLGDWITKSKDLGSIPEYE